MSPLSGAARVAALCAALCASPSLAHEFADGGTPEPEGGLIELTPSPEQPEPPPAAFETTVRDRRPFTAASSASMRARDLLLRPRPRPADLLNGVPGVFVIQHAGGGKANQYFLRGFDADHGTDVALSVDGVPVNSVSHGHGQGYTDLNWLIPELVQRVEVNKGTYLPEQGDFATAGSINLVTARDVGRNAISFGGGSFETWRALVIASPEVEGWEPIVAAEAYGTDGPFLRGEDLQRYSVFARVRRDVGERSSVSLTATSYQSAWRASGQIPLREVTAGRLNRFGSLGDDEGGSSSRHSVVADWRGAVADADARITAYAVRYGFELFSDFTFFSVDPLAGDLIEQTDERTLSGVNASAGVHHRLGGVTLDTTVGAQVRLDDIENALYPAPDRLRRDPAVRARIRESSVGLFLREEVGLTSWLRALVGVRADHFLFDVEDQLSPAGTGERQASQVSPKASLVADVHAGTQTQLFLNYGHGFHSNDARGVVLREAPARPLTTAIAAEAGVRTTLFDRLDLAVSAFQLDLEGELVWVGDEGTTEERGPTRRRGVETEARLKLLPWLYADADLTLVHGEFTEAPAEANAIPLAPSLVASGGVSVLHPVGWFGRIGVLHLGDRPATEDRFLTAQGFTRVDASAGFRHRRFELGVYVQNALDTEWREAQFATVSRLPRETSPADCPAGTRGVGEAPGFEGCEDVHFTPGAPRNVQATATLFF